MHETQANFSKFGKNFQEKLCELILKDRAFCDQIMEVLDIDFLELRHLRVFVRKIMEYKEKFKIHPSKDAMITILRAELDEEDQATQKTTRDFFVRVMSSDENPEDEDYIKHTALDFCRKQKLKEAMIKSARLIQKSSFDEISKIINEALKLGSENDFGYEYIDDFEERFMIKSRNPVTTGWDYIDEISRGGLGKGELGVTIASTGSGKSMALVHLGAQALLKGETVVHYTLELGSTVIATRYDSCITRVPLSQTYNFKDDIYEQIKDVKGKLIIKEYPTKSASPKTIRNHLERLYQRDIKPGMIIVDYADLLKPTVIYKEKRHDLETIYEDLRAIAQEHDCPIWTASQTNRSGLNAEVITMESISEAFNKCFVADFIFTLSRTVEDKRTDSGRIFVAKNRNGPDGVVFPITMRTSNVFIEVHRHLDEIPVENVVKSAKDYKQELEKKYKKFTKKGADNG
tara:strand:- start:1690 stop:3069 length:1380 start_codon:yes stop_codon:yes gene_type:complete